MDFDSYIINGSWQKCPKGHQWSESDGGACHWECSNCKDIIDDETDYDGMCKECFDKANIEACELADELL
jgi:hypothetical protein